MKNALRLLLCLVFMATGSWLAATETDYVLTDLGDEFDLSSAANAISDSGVAVGSIMVDSHGTPRRRAFYFSAGVRSFDYDSSSPNMMSSALAVNTAGCAVGWTQATDAAPIYLALWKAAESCPFNDTLFLYSLGGSNTAGRGINDDNLVVGSSATAGGESHAFSLAFGTTTTMTDLGVLPGGWASAAMAVNADGVVVGYSSSSEAIERATRWDDGSPTDLGALPGASATTKSYALAANDLVSPQIVGWSHGPQAVGHPHAFTLQDGTMTDLGTLTGGDWSEAFDVNDDGDVVGWARTADSYMHAVLWVDGVITDLNTVTGIPAGWVLAEARGINNGGQIVGRGVYGGVDRAFLLSPTLVFSSSFDDGTLGEWDNAVQ